MRVEPRPEQRAVESDSQVRPAALFDPFEAAPGDSVVASQIAQPANSFDEAALGDANMPEADAEPADDVAQSAQGQRTDASGFDPFEEAPDPSTPVEDLEAAQQAIDQELSRRESQQAFEDELPAGDADVEAEIAPGVERELPGFDADEFDSNLDDMPYDWREGETVPEALTPEQEELRRQQLAREREQATKDCEVLQSIARSRKISDISLDIALDGDAGEDYPFECALGDQLFTGRTWSQVTYRWKAAGLCHKPLYFEQVQLERYGHSWGPFVQPIMSGAHFFGTLPILPYKMGLQTPNECVYTLGYYRPGSCAPYMIEALPFTWRAALFQGAAATATAFVIP